MSGDRDLGWTETAGFDLNVTAALGAVNHEVKVFNVTLLSLALGVLTISALYCAASFLRRTRMSQRARVYESAVGKGEEPEVGVPDVRAVKRSSSFRSPLALFRKGEGSKKDESRIYYIYSNPLPVGLEEEEEKGNSATSGLEEQDTVQIKELTIEDYAKDPASGIILDPPNFYMQL